MAGTLNRLIDWQQKWLCQENARLLFPAISSLATALIFSCLLSEQVIGYNIYIVGGLKHEIL